MLGKGRIDLCRCLQCCLSFDIPSTGPEHVSQIECRRRISWIGLHQNAIEPLGFGNVSGLFSRLASRRSSENPTKTNRREGSCNSSPALISVRLDDWLR
jgi:hypothetical protein